MLMLAAIITVLGACLIAWLRKRKNMLNLAWPSRLGYHGFVFRVKTYLEHKAWKVDEINWTADFGLIAKRTDSEIAIRCLVSGLLTMEIAIKDLSEVKSRQGNLILVLMSTDPVSARMMRRGLEMGVTVMHYGDLETFADINPATPSAVLDWTLGILQNAETREANESAVFATPRVHPLRWLRDSI